MTYGLYFVLSLKKSSASTSGVGASEDLVGNTCKSESSSKVATEEGKHHYASPLAHLLFDRAEQWLRKSGTLQAFLDKARNLL